MVMSSWIKKLEGGEILILYLFLKKKIFNTYTEIAHIVLVARWCKPFLVDERKISGNTTAIDVILIGTCCSFSAPCSLHQVNSVQWYCQDQNQRQCKAILHFWTEYSWGKIFLKKRSEYTVNGISWYVPIVVNVFRFDFEGSDRRNNSPDLRKHCYSRGWNNFKP